MNLSDGRSGLSYRSQTTVDSTSTIGAPDYKMEREQEHYRLKIIDPKVSSISNTSNDYRRRNRSMDFPSEHSHRSFTKLDPLRPLQIKKIRSEDIKPIGDYLSESLERHRLMQQSQLSNKLQVNERDVNQPWNKPKVDPRLDDNYNISQLRQEVEAWSADKDREYHMISTDDDRIDLAKILTPSKRDLKEGRYEPKSQLPGDSIMAQRLKESEWEMDRNYQNQRSRSFTNLQNSNSWQYAGDFSPKSVISVNADQNKTWETDPAFMRKVISTVQSSTQSTGQQQQQQPQILPPQIQPLILVPINQLNTANTTHEETTKTSRYTSLPDLTDTDSGHGTLIRIKDERSKKPRSIIKSERREESRELVPLTRPSQRVGPPAIIHQYPGALVPREGIKESTQTTEETKRTEEVERTVRERKKEKKEKKKKRKEKHSEHRSDQRHRDRRHRSLNYRTSADYDDWMLPPATGQASNSPWNTRAISAGSGQSPYVSESYHRQTTTKRDNDRDSSRQAKLSDDRYRDEGYMLQNGESRQKSNGHHRSRHRVHKSHSSRDVYHNDLPEEYSDYSSPRPIVEYPPTLPRGYAGSWTGQNYSTNGLHKSRSFADWEDNSQLRYGSQREDDKRLRRYDMNWPTGQTLERDYRSDLLMPMPASGQNLNQREYRENVIPGGHESYKKEVFNNSGTRMGDSNSMTHFNEGKQELNYKKETTSRRR